MTSTKPRQVKKLTITFLVDNCIEWFTKLPPGFTHELPQHLRDHKPCVDKVTGVPVLEFDNFCCGAHGFAALIETQVDDASEKQLTLFDTGPDSLSLVRNLKAMQVPTEKLRSEQAHSSDVSRCVMDVHPDRPYARGIAPGPNYDKVICSLPADPEFAEMEALGGVVEKHANEHVVAGGTVYVSGEIPRVTPYEQGILGGMRWVDDKWVSEPHIMDERYAAIDVLGKGLVIFSACSHAGIVNVVKHAVDTFSRPVYMIIGGLHLATPDLVPRIPPTVEFLSQQLKPAPTYILPMHCSGFNAKVALESAFGEGCVPRV
ncbi:hypothetical protein BDZ89DRAFT_1057083 [Hymenopellis radicata]|nr:hypothetical protein BDZ89DRAFT_1057083 [Hymenopellis radicata]